MKALRQTTMLAVVLALVVVLSGGVLAADMSSHTTGQFHGAKVNKGTVTHSVREGKSVLTLSGDFSVPDTPDPHWEIVDSNGQVYLLDKLKLKGDKVKTEIEIPSYVPNVAKVVIWCAWAEVNLGEASFDSPVK